MSESAPPASVESGSAAAREESVEVWGLELRALASVEPFSVVVLVAIEKDEEEVRVKAYRGFKKNEGKRKGKEATAGFFFFLFSPSPSYPFYLFLFIYFCFYLIIENTLKF